MGRVVPESLPQFRRGRKELRPFVVMHPGLGEAAGPQAIDEHPVPVAFFVRFVHALDGYLHENASLGHGR